MITLKGLVINSRNINENDRYVTIVTEELGIVGFSAKGAQKNTGKSNSSTQLFAYASFCLNESRGRYFLESAKPINIFYGLRSDVKKVALASYLAELTKYAVMSLQPEKEVMRLILNTFYFLSEDKFSCSQLKAVFELRFACCVGHTPLLLGCRECHRYDDEKMYFIYRDGSLLCREHYTLLYPSGGGGIYPLTSAVSRSVLHALRTVCLTELERVFSFVISGETLCSLGELSEHYLLTQLDYRFDTLDFYNDLKDT